MAHPSPNTLILLDIKKDGVAVELHLPASELGMALSTNPAYPKTVEELMGVYQDSLRMYLKAHIHPSSMDGLKWAVEITDISLEQIENPQQRNALQDIIAKLWFSPPQGNSNRQFILNYDVILHQVVTHSSLVSIRQDWETGIVAEHPAEVGAICVDPRSGQIFPLIVNLESRGLWGGFKSMVVLGMRHISEGIDHLLFLLVLLLGAPLVVVGKKWAHFGGAKYAFTRLLHTTLAFTLGHSLTLLVGTVGWLRFPTRPIEVLIAVSILISALHAIRPIFPNRESWVAAGFGLIHGLAFADTISGLDLDTPTMLLSILGFNLGIEIQQLLIILLTAPFLILLSKQHRAYAVIRIGIALFAGVAAVAWVFERTTGHTNYISACLEILFAHRHAIYFLGLFLMGFLYFISRKCLALLPLFTFLFFSFFS